MKVAIEGKKLFRTERIYQNELSDIKNLANLTFLKTRLIAAGIIDKTGMLVTNHSSQTLFDKVDNDAQKIVIPATLNTPNIATQVILAKKTLCLIPNDSIQSYIRYTRRHGADTIVIPKNNLIELVYILKKVTKPKLFTKFLPFGIRKYFYGHIYTIFGGNIRNVVIIGKRGNISGIESFLNMIGLKSLYITNRGNLEITTSTIGLDTQTKSKENIEQFILFLLKNMFSNTQLTNNLILTTDLGMTSLDRVEIVTAIEDEFGISIPEQNINQSTTVTQLIYMAQNTQFEIEKFTKEIAMYHKHQLMRISQIVREIFRNTIMLAIQNIFITKVHVYGKENLKDIKTPSIFIFNHVGHLDSSVVLRVLPYRLRVKLTALADVRLYYRPLGSFLLRYFGNAYPLDKWGGPVRESMEIASDLIADGWSLLLSPEGKISKDGSLQDFKLGSAVFAVQTGIPVVPFKIEGYKKLFPQVDYKIPLRRVPVDIKIGKPLEIDVNTTPLAINQAIRNALEEL